MEETNTLGSTLKNYAYVEHIGLTHEAKPAEIIKAFVKIKESDIVILQVNKATLKAENNYGVGNQTLRLVDSISKMRPTVLVMMTNPYLLNKMPPLSNFKAILVAYEYIPSLLRASANAIMGNIRVNGKLPVSTNQFKIESGLTMEPLSEPTKNYVKEVFMAKKFGIIDSIALSGIQEKAYPGCEIVALKDGQVIYQKSFGKFTYNSDSKKWITERFMI